MPSIEPPLGDGIALAGVSALTGIPTHEIEAWAVVVHKPSGMFRMVSDMCCLPHAAAMLAQAAGDTMTDHAAEDHAAIS